MTTLAGKADPTKGVRGLGRSTANQEEGLTMVTGDLRPTPLGSHSAQHAAQGQAGPGRLLFPGAWFTLTRNSHSCPSPSTGLDGGFLSLGTEPQQ